MVEPYSPTVNLREYIENEVEHEREMRVEAAARVQHALEIQAREYERRLNDLNNSHERLDRMQGMSVSKETFETYCTSQSAIADRIREADLAWKREINKALDESRGAANRQVYLVALFLSLLTLALRFVPLP